MLTKLVGPIATVATGGLLFTQNYLYRGGIDKSFVAVDILGGAGIVSPIYRNRHEITVNGCLTSLGCYFSPQRLSRKARGLL